MTDAHHPVAKVLFVDDEQHVLDSLKRAMRKEPFELFFADCADKALDTLSEEYMDVVVSDQMMPKMSGSELQSKISKLYPETIRIILTGHADLNAAIQAINEGKISHFLTKPISDKKLSQVIHEALEEKNLDKKRYSLSIKATNIGQWEWDSRTKELHWTKPFEDIFDFTPGETKGNYWTLFETVHLDDRQTLVMAINSCLEKRQSSEIEHRIKPADGKTRWVSQLIDVVTDADGEVLKVIGVTRDITDEKKKNMEVRQSLARLNKIFEETVNSLALMAEKRDQYTAGHQQRVAKLATSMARHIKLPPDTIQAINVASKLHDIGKMYIPTEFLSKPSRLSASEMDIVKAHPQAAYDILKRIPFPWPVAEIILQHHEKLDGTGYPYGLVGDKILFEAKVLAVADVYEAMISHRPYRASLGRQITLDEIHNNVDILYDKTAVDALLYLVEKEGFDFA